MRVFFCTKKERRVRNYMPEKATAKEYPALAPVRRASLTAEAAFVLPVFLFSMLVFLFFMKLAQGYEQIQEGLAVTCRAASQYGTLEKEWFYSYLEKEEDSFSYILGGKRGISLKNSGISPVTEVITVRADYTVVFPIPVFGKRRLSLQQEVKSRVFAGVSFWREEAEGTERTVYRTKYGEVYHLYRSCSYLNPSIQMVWGREVFQRRNKKGGKYKPCQACMKNSRIGERALYLTGQGDYFHSSVGCMGLHRTIYELPLSAAGGLGVCHKCGSRD